MISEELQDQAALYALGTLDTSEASTFESAMNADAELRALVRELHDAVGTMAHASPTHLPPTELKQRVLSQIADEAKSVKITEFPAGQAKLVIAGWLPWAIAASLMFGCVLLVARQDRLQKELAAARANDALLQATIVALAPTPDGARDAKATVAWDPTRQTGVIRINNLPAAGSGKDYQLWAVDADHKDPLNAGIVHVDANGTAQVEFKPTTPARHVKGFALSLEREGGVPQREGPIVLIGTV
jgi:anti-sigma-K factor RskA